MPNEGKHFCHNHFLFLAVTFVTLLMNNIFFAADEHGLDKNLNKGKC